MSCIPHLGVRIIARKMSRWPEPFRICPLSRPAIQLKHEKPQCIVLPKKKGPVYLRLGKAGEPLLTEKAVDTWQFGKLRYLRKGQDVCILSYGIIMKKAFALAELLEKQGKSVSICSVHTLKPLDRPGIEEVLKSHSFVVVIEEHAPQGGLAPQTKQIAWDIKASCSLKTFTLKDEFIHNYGSHDDLLAAHGLEVQKIYQQIGQ